MQIKKLLQLMCISASAIFIISCEKHDDEIGESQQGQTSSGFSFDISSANISRSTINVRDTFITDNQSRILVGNMSGTDTIQSACESYFQLLIKNQDVTIDPSFVCDSAVLKLDYSYYFGDTSTNTHTIEAYSLNEIVGSQDYYNNDSLTVDMLISTVTTPVGAFPSSEFFSVRIDTAFARAIIDSSSGATNTTFENKKFGVKLKSNSADLVLGFLPSGSELVAYYHTSSDSTAKSVEFTIGNHFNNIATTYTGPLAGLQGVTAGTNKVLSSTLANDYTFIKAGYGASTLIELDSLEAILDTITTSGKTVLVDFAELEASFISLDENTVLNRLTLYEADGNTIKQDNGDLLLQEAANPDASSTNVFEIGGFSSIVPTFNETESIYTFDITNYVAALVKGEKDNFKLIMGASPLSTKQSLNDSRISGVKLKVFYSILE
ncbi:MAG: hypothetical protein AB8B61_03835 [Cyclobacteriaceae bacterium]